VSITKGFQFICPAWWGSRQHTATSRFIWGIQSLFKKFSDQSNKTQYIPDYVC